MIITVPLGSPESPISTYHRDCQFVSQCSLVTVANHEAK